MIFAIVMIVYNRNGLSKFLWHNYFKAVDIRVRKGDFRNIKNRKVGRKTMFTSFGNLYHSITILGIRIK